MWAARPDVEWAVRVTVMAIPTLLTSHWPGRCLTLMVSFLVNSIAALVVYVLCGVLAEKVHRVLLNLLRSRLPAIEVSGCSLSAFYKNYSTGGLLGFYSSGATAGSVSQLEAAVKVLQSLAAGVDETAVSVAVKQVHSQLGEIKEF